MSNAKKLPSGNFRVQASVSVNGKLIRRSFTAPTKREAEYLAMQWKCDSQASTVSDLTLDRAFSRYIESKSKVLSPNTLTEYQRMHRLYLKPLMPLKLQSITNEQIQIAINEESAHLSPKTVRNISGLLSATLKMFRPNFTYSVKLPQKQKKSLYIPTEQEIKTLLDYVKGTEMELVVLLAVFGPMRRSEICALTREDIKGTSVVVNKALAQTPDNKWVVKAPKTTAGYRTIDYPEFMRPMLEGIENKVTELTPIAVSHRFERALKACNLTPFRFHDLRHYSCSLMLTRNIPIKYIMARGGWESESVVNNIYAHILTDENVKITQRINDSFSEIYNS